MVVLVLVMILCLVLAVAVVLVVAVPARREGRDVLTPHGEHVVARVKERSESVASVTKGRTARIMASLRSRMRHAPPPEAGAEAAVPELPPPGGTASATG